jgi:GTP pyrophosphokinase
MELKNWLEQYRASVGDAASECEQLFENCLAAGHLAAPVCDRLLDLLQVLSRLYPDVDTVSTAILFVPHAMTGSDLLGDCSPGVQQQLEELLRLQRMQSEQLDHSRQRSAEGLRRLLLALVKDVRVVLIALAWRLVEMRAATRSEPELRAQLAEETMMIHAPLANRLGVWQLKWELEDLSFRYQNPDEYERITKLVAERRTDREQFIGKFIEAMRQLLADSDIAGEVKGRPKHIYSIWRKMQQKGLDFHELFDLRAVRVLVDDIPACYSVLGLVHTEWQPVPGEFDDYISNPKGNMYQSLHTAVLGPGGNTVEIQIRTREMHEHAELGVAAHWRYKEGGPRDAGFEKRITVMRQLLDSSDDHLDDAGLLESFQSLTDEDRVYVLTPGGDVIDLQAGSTVLDFAYHVHTEVGHRCRGAKINGRIVQLTHVVKTGDRVEILTAKQPRPSRDWLNPRLGYVHGARARSKVRNWFRREHYDENLVAGKEMLESELQRLNIESIDYDEVLKRYNLKKVNDLFVAIGNGDLTVAQVIQAVVRERVPDEIPLETSKQRRKLSTAPTGGDDIVIEGVGNLMTSMARCCMPVPGDPILGYITRGRGVTIHRADCPHIFNLQETQASRVIEVDWGSPQQEYPVHVEVLAYDRKELIKDISTILAAHTISVLDINSHLDPLTSKVRLQLTIRIKDYAELSELLTKINAVTNVQQARRVT